MFVKKQCLIYILLLFIEFPAFPIYQDVSVSPDCDTLVFIDNAFSRFFKAFVWKNRVQIPEASWSQLLYWIVFQEELTLTYSYLDTPPAETILRNQLCHFLKQQKMRATLLDNPDLIQWFKDNSSKIIQQIHTQSLLLRKKLIAKQKSLALSEEEQQTLNTHVQKVQEKIRKDYFPIP